MVKPILSDSTTNGKIKEFYLGCLTRFLFSCLVDADRINSSDFEREAQKEVRRLTEKTDWQSAINKLECIWRALKTVILLTKSAVEFQTTA